MSQKTPVVAEERQRKLREEAKSVSTKGTEMSFKAFGLTFFESPFEAAFGFKPEHPVEEADEATYDEVRYQRIAAWQRRVDLCLGQLAEVFSRADQLERQQLQAAIRAANLATSYEHQLQAEEAHRAVLEAKENFWQVWKLAQDAGFEMKEKYTDYLASKWR